MRRNIRNVIILLIILMCRFTDSIMAAPTEYTIVADTQKPTENPGYEGTSEGKPGYEGTSEGKPGSESTYVGEGEDGTASAAQTDEDFIKGYCTNNGYSCYDSTDKAMAAAKEYAGNVCWVDSTGIYFVVKAASKPDYESLNVNNDGLYASYSDAVFRVRETCEEVRKGYYLVNLTKYAYETHSEGYTKTKYATADVKATQIAKMYNTGTTYDRVKSVYYYLCHNIKYDKSQETGDPYSALIRGVSVCSGYAETFQIIMEKMGIESYICTGYVNGGPHMWNAVCVDGEYYYLDATFGCTTRLYEQFMLFGTNRRNNIFNINITNHSYNQLPETNIDVEYKDDGEIVIVNTETGKEATEKELVEAQEIIEETIDETISDSQGETVEAKEEPTTLQNSTENASTKETLTAAGQAYSSSSPTEVSTEILIETERTDSGKGTGKKLYLAIGIVIAALGGVAAGLYFIKIKK